MADLETLKQMIIDGDDAATAETQKLIDGGAPIRQILDDALMASMDVVGERMKNGDMFIPEVLLSASIMQACLDLLKPHMLDGEAAKVGTVIIGTVEGDVHDIGKNLVATLLTGAGFEVINLGENVTQADFIAAVKQHKPQILGMSGLLTTTIERMPEVIDALKDEGLRGSIKVIVGGAPVSETWAAEIGADAYGANAALAVARCKALVAAAG